MKAVQTQQLLHK